MDIPVKLVYIHTLDPSLVEYYREHSIIDDANWEEIDDGRWWRIYYSVSFPRRYDVLIGEMNNTYAGGPSCWFWANEMPSPRCEILLDRLAEIYNAI